MNRRLAIIRLPRFILMLPLMWLGCRTGRTDLRIAVASNFDSTLESIVARFEVESEYRVTLVSGATGSQFAQILNGAPFDLFFAADSLRPTLLDVEGRAVAGTRFTYAIGRLVVWSPLDSAFDEEDLATVLARAGHIAIANPDLAPYGRAARQTLDRLGLWERLSDRIVRGENIAQTYQFVRSGSADLGFVALSQVIAGGGPSQGSYRILPDDSYEPIVQQAVLLIDSPAARSFLMYIGSETVKEIIRRDGYYVR